MGIRAYLSRPLDTIRSEGSFGLIFSGVIWMDSLSEVVNSVTILFCVLCSPLNMDFSKHVYAKFIRKRRISLSGASLEDGAIFFDE